MIYRNSEDWLSVLSAFLSHLGEPIPTPAPKFFDVSRPVLIPAPNVSIFDPTKRNNFLSTECLRLGPIPKSNQQRYPRNIYRGSRRSRFLYIPKGDVPANARFRHPSGLWAHRATAHPVLSTIICKAQPFFFPLRKERQSVYRAREFGVHPLQF